MPTKHTRLAGANLPPIRPAPHDTCPCSQEGTDYKVEITPEPADAEPTLERCETCGAKIMEVPLSLYAFGSPYWRCRNLECLVTGPHNDPTGEKWNAMQRAIRAGRDCYNENRAVAEHADKKAWALLEAMARWDVADIAAAEGWPESTLDEDVSDYYHRVVNHLLAHQAETCNERLACQAEAGDEEIADLRCQLAEEKGKAQYWHDQYFKMAERAGREKTAREEVETKLRLVRRPATFAAGRQGGPEHYSDDPVAAVLKEVDDG